MNALPGTSLAASKDPCASAVLALAGINARQQIATAQGFIAAGQIGANSTPYVNPILSFLAECSATTMLSKRANRASSRL